MKYLSGIILAICVISLNAQTVVLLTPNGGATYNGGQKVAISWSSTVTANVQIDLSLDSGAHWSNLVQRRDSSMSYNWIVPYLKAGTSQALVRVSALDISNPPSDVSDAPFAITAAAPDAYEPNGDPAHAYPMAIGDTVKNALVVGTTSMGYIDTTGDTLMLQTDLDFYSFPATAGKLITVKTLPWFMASDSNGAVYSDRYNPPIVSVQDAGGTMIASGDGMLTVNITSTGTYYCKVSGNGGWDGGPVWCNYGMTIHEGAGPSVALLTPNGGGTYNGGQKVAISWSSTVTANVQIDLSLDNGAHWSNLIQLYDSTASYNWIVPYLKAGTSQALVRVTALNISNPPSDISDAPFAIMAAAPDAYEPNGDPAHAYPVAIGDTIKNALVVGTTSMGYIDTTGDTFMLQTDLDFYSFPATAGKLITVKTLPWFMASDSNGAVYSDRYNPPTVSVQDAGGTMIASGDGMLTVNITSTGTYYCKVSGNGGWDGGPVWCNYGMTIHEGAGPSVALLTPNGGGTYNGGQKVAISWSSTVTANVQIDLSLDNGAHWSNLIQLYDSTASYNWIVPYLKAGTSQALVRVTALNISNPPSDISDAPFAIMAAAPDAYEPNGDPAHAYPVAIGDTIKNALVVGTTSMGYIDTTGDTFMLQTDLDFYSFPATAGKLITVKTLPWFMASDSNGAVYSDRYNPPTVSVQDAGGTMIASGDGMLTVNITSTGTYYCKVSGSGGWDGGPVWCNYGLILHEVTLLNVQKKSIDSSQYTTGLDSLNNAYYTLNIASDTTNLSIKLTLDAKANGTITTGSVPSGAMYFSPDSGAQIKAFSIVASNGIDSLIKSADIIIPYDEDSLAGTAESDIIVRWLNDSTNVWSPIAYTVDTVNNLITIHTTHFSIYGVFTKGAGVRAIVRHAEAPVVFGMTIISPQKSPLVTVNYQIQNAGMIGLRVYDMRGRLVLRLADGFHGVGSYKAVISTSQLSHGMYYCKLTSGNRSSTKSFVVHR